jgi:hypothetical protein
MTSHVPKRTALALLASAPVFIATSAFAAEVQDGWRWCRTCQGLWFAGNRTDGVCPAGGAHSLAGSGDYGLDSG